MRKLLALLLVGGLCIIGCQPTSPTIWKGATGARTTKESTNADTVKETKPETKAETLPETKAEPRKTSDSKTANMTKEEFRERVKTFKNLGYGGRPWDGVNGQGGRNGYIVGRPANPIPGIPFEGQGQHEMDHVALFLKQDFIDAFGKPDKTQTRGTVMVWSWKCRDGVAEVILEAYGGSDEVKFIGVDDD